jgi:hypothetical protein
MSGGNNAIEVVQPQPWFVLNFLEEVQVDADHLGHGRSLPASEKNHYNKDSVAVRGLLGLACQSWPGGDSP